MTGHSQGPSNPFYISLDMPLYQKGTPALVFSLEFFDIVWSRYVIENLWKMPKLQLDKIFLLILRWNLKCTGFSCF